MVGLFFKLSRAFCVSAQKLAVCVLVTACGTDRKCCTHCRFILSGSSLRAAPLNEVTDTDTAVSH